MNTTSPTSSFKKATFKHFRGKQANINHKVSKESNFMHIKESRSLKPEKTLIAIGRARVFLSSKKKR